MKVIQLLFIVIALMLVPKPFHALGESPAGTGELDELADQALQMTKAGKYEEAKKFLTHFSEVFPASGGSRPLSMDELRILTMSHDYAVESINQVSADHAQKVNAVTKFRLVIDTLSSRYQPLWVEMEDPIMEAFSDVKTAAEEGDMEAYHSTLNAFLSKYNIIQPSVRLDLPVERSQALDAKITYLDHYRKSVLKSEGMTELTTLEGDLKDLFENVTEDEADPSLWWVIISTGSIIISTLSYVGWRKYKGQKEAKTTERQKN
ncbi:sporulation protein YpjB [Rossellomorea marisflavi]|nr:sporulation protein YpjB [Rossellomorea marisflavi]KQU59797.1 sporulation protein YpjB [Bacillus sp. Leaf406]MDW4527140.1 sporulation protein YpjB [Rossellomorea marisflavi]